MKRSILLFLLFFGISSLVFSQDVVLQRTSDLMPQRYAIDGDAFLEELSNGDLELRLSSDYNTLRGPDVRIFLGNSLSLNGAIEIVNLTSINHFNGERTFQVPSGVGINDFDNILFFCVAFQQFWASGTFGSATNPNGGGFVCEESDVMLSNGGSVVNICPSDNVSNQLSFTNSISAQTSNYAYLITDTNDLLTEVISGGVSFDFEGSTSETERIHGIHFNGVLNPVIGANRMQTTATDCFEHSNSNGFVTILKTADCISNFTCLETQTSGINSANTIDICPTDGTADWVALRNNLLIAPGEHYAYLITDENQTVQQVVMDSIFNFENSSSETQRVYGLHFDGALNVVVGSHRMQTTATGCFTHSGDNLFLTITKGNCGSPFECLGSLTATTNWATMTEICPTDGTADWVGLRNNLFIAPGEHYAYLITDENQTVQQVVMDSLFNFEGSTLETQRVYGVHFDGVLNPVIGANRMQTTATGCFTHSGDNLFLTVRKGRCGSPFECVETLTATTNWATSLDICSNDAIPDSVKLLNNLFEPAGEHYVYLFTDEFEILQEVVFDTIYNFEGTGEGIIRVYGLSYDGDLQPMIGEDRSNTTATECFIHSGDNLFLTINRTSSACSATSAEDTFLQNQIEVFPNPNQGEIFIDYGEIQNVTKIEVFRSTGELLQTTEPKTRLEILQSGFFLLRFITDNQTITKRVLVQK